MSAQLEYILHKAGWATLVVDLGLQKKKYAVSYLHDSLDELSSVARSLLEDKRTEARVVFMDEPGELNLVVVGEGENVFITGKWYDDFFSWGMHPEDDFDIHFTYKTCARAFANEVFRVLDNIYKTHGEEGYKSLWIQHEFPLRNYKKLEQALQASNTYERRTKYKPK